MRVVRTKLPVFFHRRLLLIVVAGFGAFALLGAKLVDLTIWQGAELRAAAERAIIRQSYLPTWRGSITDRNGVVLAEDRASWEVALPFSVISGRWAKEQAAGQAIDAMGGERWEMLSPEQQGTAILDCIGPWNEIIEDLYAGIASCTGVESTELESRIEAERQTISRMVSSVMRQQRERHEARQIERSGSVKVPFERRPIAEELQSHVVVKGLDDATAFQVQRLSSELRQRAAALLDRQPSSLQPVVELVDGRMRSLPEASRAVAIDRSRLPLPLRSDEPATLLLTGIGDHVIGRVRERVREVDVRRRPFNDPAGSGTVDRGGYRGALDMIGSSGIEAAMEDHLRGSLGLEVVNLETGEILREDHQPGDDVRLTLDIALQAHLQALIDPRLGLTRVQQFHKGWNKDGTPKVSGLPLETPLDSAAVVLDVQTGEILAMVSSPTFAEGDAMDIAARTTHAPFVHRAVEGSYPPGSILKPLLYSGAVSDGTIAADHEISCNGHLLPDRKDALRCWYYKMYGATHGPLDASEAIMRSCNIYFFTLGQLVGMEGIIDWYRKWGLDSHLDTGLRYTREVPEEDDEGERTWVRRSYGESSGHLADYGAIGQWRREAEARMLGIGQGLVTWTPLQAANAYATLARGGSLRDATLLVDPSLRKGRRGGGIGLDAAACTAALEGLERVVNETDGTGRWIRYANHREVIFDIPGVRIWGKTGTATAPPMRIDVDGDGAFSTEGVDEKITGLDHAWFVGLAGEAGENRPRYAIAVVVEYGGSGGRVAGPIAAEIIRALTAHGYLGGGSS